MVFISAGHNPKGVRVDPGAVANGLHEANIAVEFRDLVVTQCLNLGVKVIQDKDDERLGDYLERIKTGNGSVVLEFHCDAAASSTATGTTALIEAEADRLDKMFAKEIVDATSSILGIRNRGVITETQSHRKSLALMREEGIVCLLELFFLTNKKDIEAYNQHKRKLALAIAQIAKKYDDLL